MAATRDKGRTGPKLASVLQQWPNVKGVLAITIPPNLQTADMLMDDGQDGSCSPAILSRRSLLCNALFSRSSSLRGLTQNDIEMQAAVDTTNMLSRDNALFYLELIKENCRNSSAFLLSDDSTWSAIHIY
jgi:hypothetical protein